MRQTTNPKWWTDEHTSTWERTKEALKRDWEQTKHDFGSDKAPDLDQSAGDTVKQAMVKQAMGKQPVPTSTGTRHWDDDEPGVRYGWGARSQYQDHADWNVPVSWHPLSVRGCYAAPRCRSGRGSREAGVLDRGLSAAR